MENSLKIYIWLLFLNFKFIGKLWYLTVDLNSHGFEILNMKDVN